MVVFEGVGGDLRYLKKPYFARRLDLLQKSHATHSGT